VLRWCTHSSSVNVGGKRRIERPGACYVYAHPHPRPSSGALVQKILDGSRDAGPALAQHNSKRADRLQQAAGAKGDVRKRKGWDSMSINRSVRALLDQK